MNNKNRLFKKLSATFLTLALGIGLYNNIQKNNNDTEKREYTSSDVEEEINKENEKNREERALTADEIQNNRNLNDKENHGIPEDVKKQIEKEIKDENNKLKTKIERINAREDLRQLFDNFFNRPVKVEENEELVDEYIELLETKDFEEEPVQYKLGK